MPSPTRTWMTWRLALIGDGQAFGKMYGACRERVFLQPISPRLSRELVERTVTEYADVSQEAARNETQQVRKQMISPSRSVLRGLMRCGHEHRGDSRDRAPESHQADSKDEGSVRGETRDHAQTTVEVVRTSRT